MSDIEPGDLAEPVADIYALPNVLRQWRRALGWSQEDLERATQAYGGVSQKAISAIESGSNPHHRAQDGTLEKIAQAFAAEVDVDYKRLLKDLKAARDHQPTLHASAFALKLDNLLNGLPAQLRVFMEDSLMEHFYSQLRAFERAKIYGGRNRPPTTNSGRRKS